ncbi:hypothetical protein INT47_012815 [Mucor saturninus]|uniref:Uncharacterized protein n=1 Tax=Mucor saturninus TaxID=64648 RepID=A0A8H7UMI2_9FUNG|nr:hypothetical protein INT47_012815 [Mucor saturninus]
MNPNNTQLSKAEFFRLYETAINHMNREFRSVPATVSNHMYMKSGEHCKCCSQLKKPQRANNKASVNKPLVAASSGMKYQTFSNICKANSVKQLRITEIML